MLKFSHLRIFFIFNIVICFVFKKRLGTVSGAFSLIAKQFCKLENKQKDVDT